jgi:hypothetical protein
VNLMIFKKYRFLIINYCYSGMGFAFNLSVAYNLSSTDSAEYFLLSSISYPFIGMLFYFINFPKEDSLEHSYANHLSSVLSRNNLRIGLTLFILICILIYYLGFRITAQKQLIVSSLVIFEFFCQIDRLKLQYNNDFMTPGIYVKGTITIILFAFGSTIILYSLISVFATFAITFSLYKYKRTTPIEQPREFLIVGAINSLTALLLNKYLIETNASDRTVTINNLLLRVVNVISIGVKSINEKILLLQKNTYFKTQIFLVIILSLILFWVREYFGVVIGIIALNSSIAKIDFVRLYLHSRPKVILLASLVWITTFVGMYFIGIQISTSIIMSYFSNLLFVTLFLAQDSKDYRLPFMTALILIIFILWQQSNFLV